MSVDLGDGDAGPEHGEELVRRTRDVARAKHEDEVAGAHELDERVGEPLAPGDPADVEMPPAPERLVERLTGDACHRRLAGGVDLGEQQQVGVVERAEEVVEEIARARVAMRLKHYQEPACEALARSTQRGPDLLRVVSVVVDHQDATLLATHLEATVDAAELLERVRRQPPRDA